jgi:hypothetical protein
MQTANINNIQVVLDYPTSNPDLLEKCVHYILDRYRCNSNREFFDCKLEYIKMIVTICARTIDTLKSSYQDIIQEELYDKLNMTTTVFMSASHTKVSSISSVSSSTPVSFNTPLDEFTNMYIIKNSNGAIKWIDLYTSYCKWYKTKYTDINTVNKKQVKAYFETYIFCAKEYPVRNIGRGWYGWSFK